VLRSVNQFVVSLKPSPATSCVGLGRYRYYRYTIYTYINQCVSIRHHAVSIQMMVTAEENEDYPLTKTIRFALDYHTIKQNTLAY